MFLVVQPPLDGPIGLTFWFEPPRSPTRENSVPWICRRSKPTPRSQQRLFLQILARPGAIGLGDRLFGADRPQSVRQSARRMSGRADATTDGRYDFGIISIDHLPKTDPLIPQFLIGLRSTSGVTSSSTCRRKDCPGARPLSGDLFDVLTLDGSDDGIIIGNLHQNAPRIFEIPTELFVNCLLFVFDLSILTVSSRQEACGVFRRYIEMIATDCLWGTDERPTGGV